ncbi:MAG: RluA family pseudouridine synthase [Gammaproteobacteria bacterium]|nr:RluA family pseudouridine synthase [Gammaproteobacteria bacterium]
MLAAPPTKATVVTVTDADDGRRIDNFLTSRLRDVPKSRIYRMLRSGEVRVNGGRAKPDRKLKTNDQVRIPPLRVGDDAPRSVEVPIPANMLTAVEQSILFEDDAIIVIDKPAGMAVHGGSGLRWGVIDVMRALRPHAPVLELVHRLDRETSGCLVLAKDMRVLRRLHQEIAGDGIDKVYLALVAGSWPAQLRDLDMPLKRTQKGSADRQVEVDPEGQHAHTVVRSVKPIGQASLVEFELLTGRTHQIRVHAAAAGHPVAGDRKYGDPAFNEEMRAAGLRRMFLHAARITLRPHEHSKPLTIKAPLPADLKQIMEQLR